MESSQFNFASLVNLIRDNIKVFIIVGIFAAIVGVVISMPMFMEPQFRSTAVVYPLNLDNYSDESETEQLLQYFEATEVRNIIIEKFDLYTRYDLTEGEPMSRHYLLKLYGDNVVVRKTLYESVKLEVTDNDPEVAKAMADEILLQVNKKINLLINSWGQDRANAWKAAMDDNRAIMDTVETLIKKLSQENQLLDYESQSRELVRGYISMGEKNGNSEAFKNLKSWMDRTQESGSELMMLQNLNLYAAEQYGEALRSYLFWKERVYRDIDYLQIVVEPEVSDKKVWPVRWVILVVSVLSALFLTTVILAISKANTGK
jgi:capsule polysaccharide export protein KpsE/RkpR